MSDDEVIGNSSNDEGEGEGKHDNTEDKRLIASQKIAIASQAAAFKKLEKRFTKVCNMFSNLKRKASKEGVPAEPARLEGKPQDMSHLSRDRRSYRIWMTSMKL